MQFKARRIPSPQDCKQKVVEFGFSFQMEKSSTVRFDIRRYVVQIQLDQEKQRVNNPLFFIY